MEKDFDKWIEVKKKTETKGRPDIHLGDIFWCRLGVNVGVEQDGKNHNFRRPVLILKKFSSEIVLIVPLTTQIHESDWYFSFDFLNIKQQVILNQVRAIDVKRLDQYIGQLSESKTSEIKKTLIELIENEK